jgi:membrane protease YdiL (CAAX protease family)
LTSPHQHAPVILAEPDRPFWGFGEVFVVFALFIPAVGAGAALVNVLAATLHVDPKLGLLQLLAQTIGYLLTFGVLAILFARHREPLLPSLAWEKCTFRPRSLILLGLGLAVAVVILGNILRLPDVETPFDKLLTDLPSRIGIALFGVTLGPIVEELLFRGFLQPVVVDAMGVLPGIFVTSVLFGALHLMQNDFIWQSGVLITMVGFVLGVVRHVTGSTRASALTHIAYNSIPFIALLISGPPNFK